MNRTQPPGSRPLLSLLALLGILCSAPESHAIPNAGAAPLPVASAPPARLLFDPAAIAKLAVGDPIPELFRRYGARSYRLVSREPQGDGEVLLFADPVQGMLRRATFFFCEGRLAGAVYLPDDNHYQFVSDGPGRSRVQFVPHVVRSCGAEDLDLPDISGQGHPAEGGVASGCTDGIPDSDGNVHVDVLFTYNSATLANFPSLQSLRDACSVMIANANQYFNPSFSFDNSKMRLRMVGLFAMPDFQLGSSNGGEDLDRLSAMDGVGDEVHTVRNNVGADLVCFVRPSGWSTTPNTITTGSAYVPNSGENLPEVAGFSVVASNYFTTETFAHEIGHNGGCLHDPANAGGFPNYDPSYAFGRQFIATCGGFFGTQWHTVMAYDNNGYVNLWPAMSSPFIVAFCTPTGDPVNGHNMRRLYETRSWTANFRCHRAGLNCDDPIEASVGDTAFNTADLGLELTTVTNACPAAGSGTNIFRPLHFVYTPTVSGPCTISTCGTSWDTKIAVYPDCSSGYLACNDDSCGLASSVVIQTTCGEPVRIVVGAYSSTGGGAGILRIDQQNPDEPAGAIAMADGANAFSTLCATGATSACVASGQGIVNDIWFRFVGGNGPCEISTCESADFDTKIAVFEGSPSGPQVACNDDACEYTSRLTFQQVCGRVYFVLLGGYPGSNSLGSGTIYLTRDQPACNPCLADFNGDGVVNAQDLAALLGGWGGTAGDLNGDGVTNAQDLAALLASWGNCP